MPFRARGRSVGRRSHFSESHDPVDPMPVVLGKTDGPSQQHTHALAQLFHGRLMLRRPRRTTVSGGSGFRVCCRQVLVLPVGASRDNAGTTRGQRDDHRPGSLPRNEDLEQLAVVGHTRPALSLEILLGKEVGEGLAGSRKVGRSRLTSGNRRNHPVAAAAAPLSHARNVLVIVVFSVPRAELRITECHGALADAGRRTLCKPPVSHRNSVGCHFRTICVIDACMPASTAKRLRSFFLVRAGSKARSAAHPWAVPPPGGGVSRQDQLPHGVCYDCRYLLGGYAWRALQ